MGRSRRADRSAAFTLSSPKSPEDVLDVALEFTFPASDPISVDSAYSAAMNRELGLILQELVHEASQESLLDDETIVSFVKALRTGEISGAERLMMERMLLAASGTDKKDAGRPKDVTSPRGLLNFIERHRGKQPKAIWANAGEEFGRLDFIERHGREPRPGEKFALSSRTLNRALQSVGVNPQTLRARLRRIYSRR